MPPARWHVPEQRRRAALERWNLRPAPWRHPAVLSWHWVEPVTCADGSPAVLKLVPGAVPDPGSTAAEAAALRAFDGNGAVRLLAYHADDGAMLLESADPGTPVRSLVADDDRRATSAIVAVANVLHQAELPGSRAPTSGDLGAGGVPALSSVLAEQVAFDAYTATHGDTGPLPAGIVTHAHRLLQDLSASATTTVVLHGDLHHDNVLAATRDGQPGWLAIDPHGRLGDPAAEVGPMLYNPDPDRPNPELLGLVPDRVRQFADGIGQPVERVAAWGFVTAVLSAVWSEQDGGPRTRALDVAELLRDLLR